MLKRRLIPKLQLKASSHGPVERMVLVTTIQFREVREIGDPVSQAKIYEAQAVDELIFVDLDASLRGGGMLVDIVRSAAEQIFMPFTVGGGVRTMEDFRTLLGNGADKVSINTAAVDNSEIITQASEKFGAQCVVLSIDYRRDEQGSCRVWTRGGKKETGLELVEWAKEGEKRGAGEILLTSIDRDGTRAGLDIEATRAVAESVSVPVITSGGCGLASHFIDGFLEGKADAVSAGTYFCFQDQNPMQTRAHIKNAGIPIRLLT